MLRCPQCGKDNLEDAKFCAHCGVALGIRGSAARKAVTVVFSDVAGFTNLSEHLDPERVASVMSRYFDEMQSVVERHGGTVEKFIGDAVMAVFGVPQLHEDDALRAVRAAAEMRDALGALNEDLARQWGVTIQVRTGINTGEVAVGPGRGGGGFVLGDPVNVAARLQQAAAPQEILVGEDTYRLAEGAIEVEPLEPLALKGKESPVPAYRLLRVAPGRPARVARLTAPLVGREDEEALLRDAFRLSVAERACRLVTVVAPAGIGKTRLVTEFVKDVEPEATLLQGECLPYGDAITYWPVTRVVAQAAGIGDDDSPEQARAKIAALVKDEEDAELIVQRGAQVFGLGHSSTASDEVFWAVRKLLEALAKTRPVVVVFEDAHWAEPTFLDLVEHIVDWSRDAAMLLVCLARPELLEARPGWGEGRPNASLIDLQPLSTEDSERLIEQLLHSEHVSARARVRISDAAQGNALYLQELLSMLIDEGLLRHEGDRWVRATDLHEITVPPTIQALLATRIDRLPAAERRALEAASVMGTSFDPDALLALVPQETSETRAALQALVDDQLLQSATSVLDGEGLRFHHVLLREAAYNGMSKGRRADLHEAFAAWLEQSAGERVIEYEEILGHHLESAYRYRRELRPLDDHDREVARRGGEHLATAGCAAFARGDMLAAANLLTRGVELLPADHPLRISVLPNLSEALMSTGQLEQADAVLTEAFGVARAAGDPRLQAHVMLVRSVQRVFTEPEGGAEAGRQEVTRAIPLFEEAGDGLGLARAWRLLSIVHLSLGRFADAEETMDQAAAHAARAGDRRVELEALSWLPLFVWAGPTPPGPGIRRCEEILARAGDDPQVEASALSVRAAFEAMLGNFDVARQATALSRAILEDLGLRVSIAGPWSQLRGWIEVFAGDFEAAERELRLGAQALEQMGEAGWLSTVAGLLAHAVYAQGRYDEADSLAAWSEQFSGPDDLYSQVLFRSARAKVRGQQGKVDEGERLAHEAVDLAERTDFVQLRGEALMDLGEVLHLAGRPKDAVTAVESALRLYESKQCMISQQRARSRLQRLASSSAIP